ncbi:hypothetical protein [Enterobacter sp. RHBSTW-00175]|uniref:hypothetical protein n=1 Tax=Enterobacter sp. RHBSTW-00175 TaxID=2742639 RepID=UPI0015EA321A|nr:hypothetical protein [Enterobacter sp. RHBSTW-00175]QMR74849.1 hypothetical protein HV107_04120 [Enterobacter sp. RHBSTW-00175]
MAQNIYDNPAFFEGYAQLPRSVHGLDGAPEWPSLNAMLPELDTLFANVQQALKPGGSLVFSMEHPIYTCATRQGWLTDDNGERFWGVNHYQEEGQRVSNWLAEGVIKYHRPLGTTLNTLIRAGLTINEVNEWGPTQAQIDAWPALAEEAERPMLVLISARKA